MAQHDYNIANGGGAAVRSDINNALAAVQSLNSGATAPTSTVAGMLWYDTTTATLKQRNAANTAWVAAAELIGGGGQFAGMRNKIINGKMDIAQRGTSFAGLTNQAVYTLDRFQAHIVGTGVITVSQQADVPSSNEFQSSLRVTVTPTADTSIAAGDYSFVTQIIEGFNARDLIGRTFTLSFWVRSPKTGTHCIGFTNSGQDRTFLAEYTVNAANTWEYKTVTVSGGLITAGTWNWTNGIGLYVRFALAAGATFQTTAGAWQTGNFFGTANQVNCLDAVSNIFAITGVQLEVGGVATPFEHRPFGAELQLCQRYYETGGSPSIWSGNTVSTAQYYVTMRYAVPKRAVPSQVAFTEVGSQGFSTAAPILSTSQTDSFLASKTSNNAVSGGYFQFTWTSSAEL